MPSVVILFSTGIYALGCTKMWTREEMHLMDLILMYQQQIFV